MSDLLATERDAQARTEYLNTRPRSADRDPGIWGGAFSDLGPGAQRGLDLTIAGAVARGADVLEWGRENPLAAETFMQTQRGLQAQIADPAWAERARDLEPDNEPGPTELALQRLSQEATTRRQGLRPNPSEVGTAGQILGGLAEITVPLALGSLYGGQAGGALVLSEAYAEGTAQDLMAEGVDEETARRAGRIEGFTLGASAFLPAALASSRSTFLARVLERSATGAGINVSVGMASREGVGAYLRSQGYEEQANRYRALDAQAVITDAILGSVFGSMGRRAEPKSARNNGGAPGGANETPDAPIDGPTPEEIDAALTLETERRARVDSAPGIPLDLEAEAKHAETMARVERQAIEGEPIDAGAWSEEDAARFAPHPVDYGTQAQFDNAIRDARAELGSFADDLREMQEWEERARALGMDVESIAGPGVMDALAPKQAPRYAPAADIDVSARGEVDAALKRVRRFTDRDDAPERLASALSEARAVFLAADEKGRRAIASYVRDQVEAGALSPQQAQAILTVPDILASRRYREAEVDDPGDIGDAVQEFRDHMARLSAAVEALNQATNGQHLGSADVTEPLAKIQRALRDIADPAVMLTDYKGVNNADVLRPLLVEARDAADAIVNPSQELSDLVDMVRQFADAVDAVVEHGTLHSENIWRGAYEALEEAVADYDSAGASAEAARLADIAQKITWEALGDGGETAAQEALAVVRRNVDELADAIFRGLRLAYKSARDMRDVREIDRVREVEDALRDALTQFDDALRYVSRPSHVLFSRRAERAPDPEGWRSIMGTHPWINSPSRAILVDMARQQNADGTSAHSSDAIAEASGYSSGATVKVLLVKAKQAGVDIAPRKILRGNPDLVPIERLVAIRDQLRKTGVSRGAVRVIAERTGLNEDNVRQRLWRHDNGNLMASRSATEGFSTIDSLRAQLAEDFGSDWVALERAGIVEIVQSTKDLPVDRSVDLRGVKGVHMPKEGRTYFVADNVRPGEAKALLLHEIGVHHGLPKMLGERGFKAVIRQVDMLVKNEHPLALEARQAAEMGAFDKKDIPEETLAYLIEFAPDLPITKRILASIRQWLVKTFGSTFGLRLTVEDIRALALSAVRKTAADARRKVGPVDLDAEVRAIRAGALGAEDLEHGRHLARIWVENFGGGEEGEARAREVLTAERPTWSHPRRIAQIDAALASIDDRSYTQAPRSMLSDVVEEAFPEIYGDPAKRDSSDLLAAKGAEPRRINLPAPFVGAADVLANPRSRDILQMLSDQRRMGVDESVRWGLTEDGELLVWDGNQATHGGVEEGAGSPFKATGEINDPLEVQPLFRWLAREKNPQAEAYGKLDPVEQALADDPNMKLRTQEGEALAREVIAIADENAKRAAEMGKGFDAAMKCAIRHGGMLTAQAGRRAARDIVVGQGIGLAAAIPVGYGVAMGARAAANFEASPRNIFDRRRDALEQDMQLGADGFIDAPVVDAPAQPDGPRRVDWNEPTIASEGFAGTAETAAGPAKVPPAPPGLGDE